MVTVVVGSRTDTGVCRVHTLDNTIVEPTYVEFNIPCADRPLVPGSPSWANYIKGVTALYKGNISTDLIYVFSLIFQIY